MHDYQSVYQSTYRTIYPEARSMQPPHANSCPNGSEMICGSWHSAIWMEGVLRQNENTKDPPHPGPCRKRRSQAQHLRARCVAGRASRLLRESSWNPEPERLCAKTERVMMGPPSISHSLTKFSYRTLATLFCWCCSNHLPPSPFRILQ